MRAGSNRLIRITTALVSVVVIILTYFGSAQIDAESRQVAADYAGMPGIRPTPVLLTAPYIEIGAPATEFALDSLDGSQIWLSDLSGKLVIVSFWATWCPPCQAELPELALAYPDLSEQGVEILAVNVRESIEDVAAFSEAAGLNYPVLLDSRGFLTYAYGVRGLPTSFFIDRQGILQHIQVGAIDLEIIQAVIKAIEG